MVDVLLATLRTSTTSGRGAKDAIPLHRDADGEIPNVAPDLLHQLPLANASVDDFAAYVYGLLAQPAFTARFAEELDSRQPRVPITTDEALFGSVREVGRSLLKLHIYHAASAPRTTPASVPPGAARCTKDVPMDEDGYPDSFSHDAAKETLRVGDEFAPVPCAVYEFEASGLKVVQSWLRYRMKHGTGRQSFPLNDIRPTRWPPTFTDELLALFWVLEGALTLQSEHELLLDRVVAAPCLQATVIAPVDDALRKPPKTPRSAPISRL